MSKHQVKIEDGWLNIRYDGEDADDGCKNELSLYRQPDHKRLQLLLSNVDFDGQSHDNTFSFDRRDAQQIVTFLEKWLEEN